MLADCYGHMGSDEQRLDALRQAAGDDRGPEIARVEFAGHWPARASRTRRSMLLWPLLERTARTAPRPRAAPDPAAAGKAETTRACRRPSGTWPGREGTTGAVEPLALLRADLLAASGRFERGPVAAGPAQAKDPRNLRYRLALARLAQRQGQGPLALQILDQAEKELGPSLEIQLARLDYWGLAGGDEAKAAVAKLAETRQSISAADRPAFLDRLAAVEIRLGEPALAREHCASSPGCNRPTSGSCMGLFDLAMQAGDHADALEIVARIRAIEGERGTLWRFGQASCLLDQAAGARPE